MQAQIDKNDLLATVKNDPTQLVESLKPLVFSELKTLLEKVNSDGLMVLHILAKDHPETLHEILKPRQLSEKKELLEAKSVSGDTVHILAESNIWVLFEMLRPFDFSYQKELLKKKNMHGDTVLHSVLYNSFQWLRILDTDYAPAERYELLRLKNDAGKSVQECLLTIANPVARFVGSFIRLPVRMIGFTLERIAKNLIRAFKPFREDKYYYGKTSNEANRRYYGENVSDFRRQENIALVNLYGKLEYILDAALGIVVYPTRLLATLIFGKRDPMQKAFEELNNDLHSQSHDSNIDASSAKMLQALGGRRVEDDEPKLTSDEQAYYKAIFDRHPSAEQKCRKYALRGISPSNLDM